MAPLYTYFVPWDKLAMSSLSNTDKYDITLSRELSYRILIVLDICKIMNAAMGEIKGLVFLLTGFLV